MISTSKVLKIMAAPAEEQEKMIDRLSIDDARYLLKVLFKQMKGGVHVE